MLRLVEGFVRRLQERFGLGGIGGKKSSPDAHRDPLPRPSGVDLRGGDGFPKPFRRFQSAAGGHIRKEDYELLSAEAGDNVRLAQGPRKDAGDLLEDEISHRVAVNVVEALEVVDIGQEESETRGASVAARELAGEGGVEVAAVEETGEGIGRRQVLDPVVDDGVLEDHRRLVAVDAEKPELAGGEGFSPSGQK